MKEIDLEALRQGYHGRPYSALIEHHLRKQTQQQRLDGLQGTILLLPPQLRSATESLIDKWNAEGYDQAFWQNDCAVILDEILSDAELACESVGVTPDDELLFNIFNIITLNFAAAAATQPEMQKFLGIEAAPFPIWSLLALSYPVAAMLYMASRYPEAPFLAVIGYGLSNLGYVLLAAGLIAGSFRVLGLQGRGITITAGVVAWLLGVVLSNV